MSDTTHHGLQVVPFLDNMAARWNTWSLAASVASSCGSFGGRIAQEA